ncbi:hypothetical protein BAUCODRAFT_38535 [Baudoinia panamericana UAMH 10762]|uniref:ZZ-type domain-containing protein n=1 Tax=Baudoinia panamericana (strain UAMH 10762) TaxID=717646 RepID=M2MM69_BAUPA|nr:uncharacterized protein BAUCODRAFT_38535 [Baudoinia panamericana UAMH 10762]EMC92468.1 hypothetical protein BAUCODRAFT_38535 [Baudoinia panamericana UAMH 10762]
MAAPNSSGNGHNHNNVSPDTLITIKISVNDNLKKIKLPLKELGAGVLLEKLRNTLGIKDEQTVIFERFSDSAGGYITLNPSNPQVFKTLIRAAKAKLKLRLKATVTPIEQQEHDSNLAASKTVQPVIVRSPVFQANGSRDSLAFDGRSVGSGIFQFREARASQQTLVNTGEAPVPGPFSTDRKDFFDNLANSSNLTLRQRDSMATIVNNHGHPWSVYCNECDKPMANAHFHCSICDGGDYDLCEECVDGGKLCPGEGHWLIKRFIENGKVINSTTERISPRMKKPIKAEQVEIKQEMPGAFAEDTKTLLAEEPRMPTRTCNSCVVVLPETEFVTCTGCEDFDLCIGCHTSNKHGHHPAHGFKPATEETVLSLSAESMLAPGRNIRHNAICDGCDKTIYGVRHKCLNCPDWDFCNECVKNASHIHPRHRFAALYTPIVDAMPNQIRHYGIYCDGPLCSSKSDPSYITGVRYKCAVCHDTDFCANCEAFPGTDHNRTHPLIKFKTPVRNVSITTENEDLRGNVRMMGDRRAAPAASPAPTSSAATETTPVQTMAEIKPTVVVKQEVEQAQPIPIIQSEEPKSVSSEAAVTGSMLNAEFVHDTFKDGSVVAPGVRFTQIWTLKNSGPHAWPAGCSVRFTGGDNMLNVDNNHPSSVSDIAEASESNVVGRKVEVGEEIAFKVVLKAPTRVGKAISYWRLKAADGTPFGHRLWCDVLVKDTEPETGRSVDKLMDRNIPQGDMQARMARMHAMQMQQRAMQQQQAMMRSHMEMMAKQGGAKQDLPAPPPAYNEVTNETLQARLAIMRAEQQSRRAAMMAQFTAKQRAMNNPDVSSHDDNISPSPSESEMARKEAARARVEHIKAKIMRQREERANMLEAQKMQQTAVQKSAEESEKVKKIIEEVEKEQEMEGSQMVFPKLEKESPASSTYESTTSSKAKPAYVENEADEVESTAAVPSVTAATAAVSEPSVASPAEVEGDFDFEEVEVLSASGDMVSEDDDGFLTDEEYDILDASDHETVASK